MVPVSGEWWYDNRSREFSAALVLPRREANSESWLEKINQNTSQEWNIVADCEVLRRQMLRLRNDLNVKLPTDFDNIPSMYSKEVEWLENIRENGEIDGFITTRTLHSSLKNKPRRHTLGMQRKDDARSRFIPIPLEGYTVLLTRKDFPASRFSKVIDMGQHCHCALS